MQVTLGWDNDTVGTSDGFDEYGGDGLRILVQHLFFQLLQATLGELLLGHSFGIEVGTVHVGIEESEDSGHTRLVGDSTSITSHDAGGVGGTVVASVSGHDLMSATVEASQLQGVFVRFGSSEAEEKVI